MFRLRASNGSAGSELRGWRVCASFAVLLACTLSAGVPASAAETTEREARIVLAEDASVARPDFTDAAISAVKLAAAGKHEDASRRLEGVDDAAARTLVEWYAVRSSDSDADFDTIVAFMANHGDWPLMETIRGNAERALYLDPPDARRVLAHFRAYPPQGGLGKIALARALRDTGDDDAAREAIRDAWRNHDFGESTDNKILREFKGMLDDSDHRTRLVRQLYAQRRSDATRTAALISSDHVKLAQAAGALFRRNRNALSRYRAVPSSLRHQLVMQYALAYYYRRRDKYQEARDIVLQVPGDPAALSFPEPWWTERLTLARYALRRDTPELWEAAYRMTSAHGFTESTLFVQGEFMSGWIALQFLKDPNRAIPHFKLILERDQKVLNVSQAHYWLGRAYNALGDAATAEQHFTAAAALPTTFYGQLALDALGRGEEPLALAQPPAVSSDTAAEMERHEQVRAIHLLAAAGQDAQFRTFFSNLVYKLANTEQRVALVRIANDYGATHIALRTAKLSARMGDDLGHYAYPRDVLPDYPQPRRDVEIALVHGLIRQESEFNPEAISHAGARGLMQLMPGTAKMVARQHGFSYSRSNLTNRPSYNLTLGTAHVADLLEELGGSYIMTIAAYNAGAGRIPQWTERYGDPRRGQVEPVDFIESIPFNETRNYVKRVLENVQIYRTLFGQKPLVALRADLTRGSDVVFDTAGAIECDAEQQSSIEQLIACN